MKVKEFTTAITEQFTSLGKETTNMTIFGTSVWGEFKFNGFDYHVDAFLRAGKAKINVKKSKKAQTFPRQVVTFPVLYLDNTTADTIIAYVKVIVESSIANAKIEALI